MKLQIKKTETISGEATPPSSKSQTIRGLMVATLANGVSFLHNILDSDDAENAINACRILGAEITKINCHGNCLEIISKGVPLLPTGNKIFTGNSGITTRFVLPMLGLRRNIAEPIVIDCGEQMKQRPIKSLTDALVGLGMDIALTDGHFPLEVKSGLSGGVAEVEGVTSQYLSALLLSAPLGENNVEIKVNDLHERPYVEMTELWLKEQKIKYTHTKKNNEDWYRIIGGQKYRPIDKHIPGDFSSASYLIAAGVLLPGQVTLHGLDMADQQGDKRLVAILQEMGADIKIEKEKIVINGGSKLKGVIIDANDIPDMLPTLAVVATQAEGKTEIINVEQARIKETDRIHSMSDGLKRMGAGLEEKKEGMIIYQSRLQGAEVRGYDDHRTVMALALAGMLAEGETIIDSAEAISKTFPRYVTVMQSLGAQMGLV